ncbi:MAG: hypothetical protein M3N56_16635 [Actinomycetota bacterium]|nr:hypothetical protein [Actinomycetota bacterium]
MAAVLILRSETTGLRPEFEHDLTSERDAVKTPEGSPVVHARQKNERARRVWGLRWAQATPGQRYLLESAWQIANGPTSPMAYTPIGDVDANAVEVFFVDDTLRIEQLSAGFFRMDVEIEEGR